MVQPGLRLFFTSCILKLMSLFNTSLACLTALGRYSDSLKLVTKWLEAEEPTADLLVLKARLQLKLNQVGERWTV